MRHALNIDILLLAQVCMSMDLKSGPETEEDLLKSSKIIMAMIFISSCWHAYIFLKVVSKKIAEIH